MKQKRTTVQKPCNTEPIRPNRPADHPLRGQLEQVLHDRPFLPLSTPSRISSFSWVEKANTSTEQSSRGWIRELCKTAGVPGPGPDSVFHHAAMDAFSIRWERHTEFCSLTIVRDGPMMAPFSLSAHDLLPADWLQRMPGEVLSALEICVEDAETEVPPTAFHKETLCSSNVAGGKAQVWTDFQQHDQGLKRFYIEQSGASNAAIGRLVQRLIELEVYKSLALHGFSTAKTMAPQLDKLEQSLVRLTQTIASQNAAENQEHSLHEVLALSAKVEDLVTASSFRFSATRAYAQIVEDRCEAIKEGEIQGFSTLTEFIDRRFKPAMRTCRAVESRSETLAGHLAGAVNLLNIQVSVELERQHKAQGEDMNRRAARSLRLQETVEGLSVIAISYYATGLLGEIFKGLSLAGLPIQPDLAKAVAVPFVVFATWWTMQRIHRRLEAKAPTI